MERVSTVARPPIYADLAERIRSAILFCGDGLEIPSIRSLVRLHGAAPDTVRKALQLLVEQGEILPGGLGCRYIRRNPKQGVPFCKPYPAVAVLSQRSLPFGQDDYSSRLLEGLLVGLRSYPLPCTILPEPQKISVSVQPDCIIVQPGGHRFGAVVFVSGAPQPLLQAVVEAGVVGIALDCLSDMPGIDSVAIDCEAEGDSTVEYLATLGHVHIGFLAPRYPTAPSHWTQGVDPDAVRLSQAMLQAKQRLRLNASSALHHYYLQDTTQTDTSVRLGVDRLWRADTPPTALVCFDPFTAAHASQALSHRGLRSPAHVSILARDCIQSQPAKFTLLVSDPHQMGLAAAGHLIERLSNPRSMARKLQFPTVLVQGPTTGPPPTC